MAAKGKQPALLIYAGDWFKDTELAMCSPSTRGIWFEWLLRMREQSTAGRAPRLKGPIVALGRLARCSPEEAQAALVELHTTDTASVTMSRDVTLRHAEVTDVVTLENRRMSREWKASQGAAERQRRKRERDAASGRCHEEVTTPLSSSSSSSVPKKKKKERAEDVACVDPRVKSLGNLLNSDEKRLVVELMDSEPVDPAGYRSPKLTDEKRMRQERCYLLAALERRTRPHVGDGDTSFELWRIWREESRKAGRKSKDTDWRNEVECLRVLLEPGRNGEEVLAGLAAARGTWRSFDYARIKGNGERPGQGRSRPGRLVVAHDPETTRLRRERMKG